MFVDVSSMPQRHDDDQQDVINDRVNDPVVPHSQSITRPTTQRASGRWPRVLSEKCDSPLNARTDLWVYLAQRSRRRWANFNPIEAHTQPRSDLT